MLASCTTSRCAAWDTIGSEDKEMIWSQTPDRVLHWRGQIGNDYNPRVITLFLFQYRWWRLQSHELTTFRILFSVSYTEQSWGTFRREHCYLKRMCQNGVIIGISAVGGYKQKKKKTGSLAPITPNTPTQPCTNTKQMNHHCGGTSLSPFSAFSLSLCLLRSPDRLLSLPPSIFPTYIFSLNST